MFSRLRDHWVYGGALAGLLLLALTPILARDWPLPLVLIWLHLPVYMLHQYEEHDADRFRLFVNGTVGGGAEVLTPLAVFVINIPGVWGIDALAFAAAHARPGLGLVAVYLSLVNGLAHLGPALARRRYNPGLGTAVVLFLPLGVGTLWVMRAEPWGDHLAGLAGSLAIHGAIIAHTLRTRAKRLASVRPG